MLWRIGHSFTYFLNRPFLIVSLGLPGESQKHSCSYPLDFSSEEISAAASTSTQTFRRAISVLPLHLVGFGFCDEFCVVIIHVVEREFRPSWNGLGREEGEIVDVDIGVVVRDCVDGAVGITRVVDEACRATKVHAVTHVL